MKIISLVLLAMLMSCASDDKKDKVASSAGEPIKQETFTKQKPLKNSEVADYYAGNQASLNPALSDETIDRSSAEEIAQLADTKDPLLEISIRCARGDFKTAFTVASRSFDKYQRVAPYWNLIANCHLYQGYYRKALLFYNKAIEVKPDYVPALNNIGVMYSRQGLNQKALVAFERANKASKFAKTPRYNLAKLYLTYGMAELARPIFMSLSAASEQDVDLLNAVAATHFLLGDYESALNSFDKIPKPHWSKAEIGLNIAVTLEKLGKSDEAEQVFSGIEKPKSAELSKYYASVRKHLGETK